MASVLDRTGNFSVLDVISAIQQNSSLQLLLHAFEAWNFGGRHRRTGNAAPMLLIFGERWDTAFKM